MEDENEEIQDYQALCWVLSVLVARAVRKKWFERQRYAKQPKNFDESWRELEALGVLEMK